MNPFHGFLLKPHRPALFTPKVTPDPSDSEKLEAKLQEAVKQLTQATHRHAMYGGNHHAARR